MKLIRFLSFFLITLASCTSKTTYEPVKTYPSDFFEIHVGKETIYQIDSLYFNDFTGKIDSLRGELKETVVDSFIDIAGKPSYLAYRVYKRDGISNWTPNSSILYSLYENKIERVENNNRMVIQNLPIYSSKKWNGNPFSIIPNEFPFSYKSIEQPYTTKFGFYPNTIIVLQNEEVNFIQDIYSDEVYAKSQGLIKREYRNIEIQSNKPRGYKITWLLKSIK